MGPNVVNDCKPSVTLILKPFWTWGGMKSQCGNGGRWSCVSVCASHDLPARNLAVVLRRVTCSLLLLSSLVGVTVEGPLDEAILSVV